MSNTRYTIALQECNTDDIQRVGGKAAALGEMIQNIPDLKVPDGFVVTSNAFDAFITGSLHHQVMKLLDKLPVDDLVVYTTRL